MQLESSRVGEGKFIAIAQLGSYARLEGPAMQEGSVRTIEINEITVVTALVYLAVKAGDLPVRIADQHLILFAAVHGDAANVRNFLV